jgi:hypothetical protein
MSRSYPLLVLGLLVAGAFIVVSTFAFGSGAVDGIVFGVSIATLLTGGVAAALAPTRAQTAANAGVVLASAWTILVALGIFSGATQTWLLFAGGAAVATAALASSAAESLARPRSERSAPVAVPSPVAKAA